MQNAKDTFYEVLRGRLATLNPERTIVARGVTRPGVLVDENEMQASSLLPDCFHLVWTTGSVDTQGALPVATQTTEITYATAGSPANGGLDRGRLLAAMDLELLESVRSFPQNTIKNDYKALANGGSVVAKLSNIWWSSVEFGAIRVDSNRIVRSATVAVMSYVEGGDA